MLELGSSMHGPNIQVHLAMDMRVVILFSANYSCSISSKTIILVTGIYIIIDTVKM